MARDISNNTLVVLLVVAILVSVLGTWASLGKLTPITGYSAVAGTTTATVNETIDISVTSATVGFGNMQTRQHNDTSDDSPAPFNFTNEPYYSRSLPICFSTAAGLIVQAIKDEQAKLISFTVHLQRKIMIPIS